MMIAAHIHQQTTTKLTNPYFPDLPKQTMTRDFHLDTLFNPIWTDGPHVFIFSESGTVVRPTCVAPRRHASNAFRQPLSLCSRPSPAARTYANAVTTPSSSLLGHIRKPWKNATMTEQDDAEFKALMAYGTLDNFPSPQSTVNENESVCPWPPVLSACYQEVEAENLSNECEKNVPSTSFMVSPPHSQISETDSPVILTPDMRGDHISFMVLHDTSSEEEALEKVLVRAERLRRKAPPPLCLGEHRKEESVHDCVLLKENTTIPMGQEVSIFNLTIQVITHRVFLSITNRY
ncbi:hypothetical protein V8B97DRAFT_1901496 [Scleroderma yunnanense]